MPELYPDLEPYWQAFCALHNARQSGFAVQPITVAEVRHYCDVIGLPGVRERRLMLDAVQTLDQEFLRMAAEDSKRKS